MLKSELARKLSDRDPSRAAKEMAEVELGGVLRRDTDQGTRLFIKLPMAGV